MSDITSPSAPAEASGYVFAGSAFEPKAVARRLRPLLPVEAFATNPARLGLIPINLAILVLGWQLASHLDRLPLAALLLWLPLAVVMGNSVFVLGLLAHDLMHGSLPRQRSLRRLVGLVAFSVSWMTPTLWQAVHNREHHGHTNGLVDPDRSYLESQPSSWGKRLFRWIAPSSEVHPLILALGMTSAWPLHHFRTTCSVLLFNTANTRFTPAAFLVSKVERQAIALELLVVVALHAGVISWIGLRPVPLLLGYFLPLWIGYAIAMIYIYTNHMLSPLTEDNDPLVSSLSLRMPAWVDLLHCNFSHHSEHHVFPGFNSNYYPLVRELLLLHYPDRFQLMGPGQAWRLMLSTPRFYRDALTLVNWDGTVTMPVPCSSSGPKNSKAEAVF
ncbi:MULTISPECIES: fatty acid desaturase family protein [Synechococcales]|uniref:fatty acid desaturase family protein n=1 Tax=unclassified Synechococcus TaxID=2626047 RepID=UPI0021A3D062|nr:MULTISPECIES: fatty acid desaturase [unclassified Synechococcus]